MIGLEKKPSWKITSFWWLALIWFTNAFAKIGRKTGIRISGQTAREVESSSFIYAVLLSSCCLCVIVTIFHL